MAYSRLLAERLYALFEERDDISERKMFGGLALMLANNMCVGVIGDTLMVRVGPEAYEVTLLEPYVREMDFTGKPLRGFVYVATEGIADDEALAAWVARGVEFAASLPAK